MNMAPCETGPAPATADDPRWAAVLARDPAADGAFVYAVRSTGVFCRPTCPSRRARPDKVVFYPTPEAAVAAGFRPCRRCRPDQRAPATRSAGTVAVLCRFLEASESVPTLQELARRVGLSPSHLHRLFKAATGLTPRAYAAARRAQRLRQALSQGGSVTEALYAAGYNSSGRFYAEAAARLGMSPTRYRAGGAGAEIRFALGQCALGALLVAASDRGVCAIDLGDDPAALLAAFQARFPAARLVGDDPAFQAWVAQVVGLVEAPRLGRDLPLDIRGTAFQQRVWQALRAVPPGQTVSYAELARRIGAPAAVRAVAAACAANPLALAIPCHRVVRQDGGLAGYRWGLERKAALLAREAAPGVGEP
jgi:AraC family transcriptional regulator of adaptative response/methylated-DNA-[protein]-cysteine methyltransferase